jgi:Ca-activated chloride channel homolog
MLLRNSRVPVLLIVFLSIAIAAGAQATGQPGPSSNTPASSSATSSGPASPPAAAVPQASQAPAPQAQPSQAQPSQAQPSQAQPSGTQPTQSGQNKDQGQEPSDSGVFVFKKEVEEVVVHATVVDDKNRHLVTDLERSAFSVFENNQAQAITSFRHEDVPVAMGIVIDNSGSMREKRDKVNKAALNLVRSSNPQDQVFVVNFNDEYYLDQDFTSDIKKLREALEKVEARGGTALYDAMLASANHLKEARLQKKVLFVVTDGEDNASRNSLEQTVRRLQEENGPTVYAIGLLGEEKARRARRALETIAQRTGGISFFPRTLDEVDEISRTVAHDIRNQYTIGYKPSTPKSIGGYRAIRVEAKAKGYGKLVVRTRSGYYPGQEHAPQ